MRSYIKLYGPSIYKGQEALDSMMMEFAKKFEYGEIISHIISVVDPSIDLMTGELISGGSGWILGEYDYAVEWKSPPTSDQVKMLIRRIDEALQYTGCRYTITTKQ